jgi:hypothetical protein
LNNQINPLTAKFRESDATLYNEYRTSQSIVTNAASRGSGDAAVSTVTMTKAA